MSSWIRDANAGSLMILSWNRPALISRSRSSALRPARSRHDWAATSASSSAPGCSVRRCAAAVAVALASMIVPIASHQLVDLEDHDAHFEARGDGEEQYSIFPLEAALTQVLPESEE